MLNSYIHQISAIVAVFCFLFLQSVSAQKFLLTDVKANRVGGLAVPGAKRVLLFYAERARHDSTVLRQYWLDEQMRLRNSHQLVLRGPYLLQGLLRSRSHVLYEFRRQGYDTLISVVADTLGRTVVILRERRIAVPARAPQYVSLDLPNAPGFARVAPAANRSCRLVYRTPDMRLVWEKNFERGTEVVASTADSSHLWVITTISPLSRHPTSQAVCPDLRTGQEIGRAPIGPAKTAWVPVVIGLGSQHELLMAGYAFTHAASRTRTGDLFYLRLTPAGKALVEQRTTLANTKELQAARGGRVHWALIQPDRDGDVRLVGETFQSSPYGACFARSFFSAGLLGYSVLRPRDVISLTLDPVGQVRDVHTIGLRRDRGSFVWPVYL